MGLKVLDHIIVGEESAYKKISDALTQQQKGNWVRNLLQEMQREELIHRVGAEAGPGAKWILSKTIRKVDR